MAKKKGKATGDEPVPGAADESVAIPDFAEGFESLAKFEDDAPKADDAVAAGDDAAAGAVDEEPAADDLDESDADEAADAEPADDAADADADETADTYAAYDADEAEPLPDELAHADEDDDEPDASDDDDSADELLTEAEQIAATVASARPVRKTEAEAKGRATPKQERATKTDERPRVGPITFVQQSIDELKKVNWPSLDQWQQYFIVVLVFVLVIIAYVGLLDLGLGYVLLKIFGDA